MMMMRMMMMMKEWTGCTIGQTWEEEMIKEYIAQKHEEDD